MLGDWEP